MDANQKPNQALPELTELLFQSQDKARDILKKYFAKIEAPEAVSALVDAIEYGTQMAASSIREVGTADDPLESAAFEIEDTVKRLAENTAAVSSFLDQQGK